MGCSLLLTQIFTQYNCKIYFNFDIILFQHLSLHYAEKLNGPQDKQKVTLR